MHLTVLHSISMNTTLSRRQCWFMRNTRARYTRLTFKQNNGINRAIYTAVSVWLWEERRSTSISGTVNSSGSGHMSAYSREEPWERRLLREDCFFSTAARLGFEGRASSPCRKALTTRICKRCNNARSVELVGQCSLLYQSTLFMSHQVRASHNLGD